MFHALRFESLFPGLAGDDLGADGVLEDAGEGCGDFVWGRRLIIG
jgi:hypothetical protein